MKRNSKYVLVVLSVLILLLVLPACNRKSDGSENTSVVSQLISKESNSDSNPIVVVQEPQPKEEKKEVPATAETVVSSPVSEPSTVSQDVVIEEAPLDDGFEYDTTFSYMGLESEVKYNETEISIILPFGTTEKDVEDFVDYVEGEYPLIENAEYDAASRTLVFTYPEQKAEDADGLYSLFETSVKAYIDSIFAADEEDISNETYNVKFTVLSDINAVFYLDNSTLTVSLNRTLNEDEYNEIADAVIEYLPELASSYAYVSGDGLVYSIQFDAKSTSDLDEMYHKIMDLLSLYCENVGVITASIEEPVAVSAQVVEEKKAGDEVAQGAVVVEETKTQTSAVSKTLDYSTFGVSVSGSLYYDIPHNILRGTVGGRVEYSFMPDFSFGVKGEYDFGGYINVLGYLKWNFYDSLYAYIGGGYKFGLGDSRTCSSFLLEGGLGYSYHFGAGILGYAELGAAYAPMSYTKISPVINLGIRYTF